MPLDVVVENEVKLYADVKKRLLADIRKAIINAVYDYPPELVNSVIEWVREDA